MLAPRQHLPLWKPRRDGPCRGFFWNFPDPHGFGWLVRTHLQPPTVRSPHFAGRVLKEAPVQPFSRGFLLPGRGGLAL